MVTAAIAAILIGLSAGVLSGLLGLGGGVFMVPAMVLFLGLGQHTAQGTSLAVMVPTAAVGAWTHFRRGRISLGTALPVALGGLGGAVVGSVLALHLGGPLLQRVFGVWVLFLAVRMFLHRERS